MDMNAGEINIPRKKIVGGLPAKWCKKGFIMISLQEKPGMAEICPTTGK